MRLRNLKDKEELLRECSYLVKDGSSFKGKWQDCFGNDKPIHLEIGIEKYTGVVARVIKKYPRELPNLRILNMDALDLENVFEGEIDVIYLNFSDPWPKKRQAKRRLSSEVFLSIYDGIFKSRQRIVMKTDNLVLFASSLVSLSNYGYVLKDVNLDLANSEIETVPTEYEMKFRSKGVKINYLVAEKNTVKKQG